MTAGLRITIFVAAALVVAAACAGSPSTPPAGSGSLGSGVPSAANSEFPQIGVSSSGPVNGSLQWDAVPGAASYRVMIASTDGGEPYFWDGPGAAMPVGPAASASPDTTFTLETGKSYRWFVAALDDAGVTIETSPGQQFTCGAGCGS
jgi:hypothetical protein